jgi:hypothetical protein
MYTSIRYRKRFISKIFFSIIILLSTNSCNEDEVTIDPPSNPDLLSQLNSLNGVEVTEMTPQNGYERQFEILFSQPLDHNNPGGVQFKQRVYLSHTDADAPVVFMPSGYSTSPRTVAQLSEFLNANQVYAEQRFMSGNGENPTGWQYLTMEQATSDFHNVVARLKSIYKGVWVSYGSSKNGIAALFHRRYYPDDVKASFTKVAPLSLGTTDPRYDAFLENVGNEFARNKIKGYQRALLKNRTEILPLIRNYMNNSNMSYTVTEDVILEFETCEFAFGFWQTSDRNVSQIPDSTATAQELFNYMESFGYIPYYSEDYVRFFEPVYYQAYTEQGWYRMVNDHLKDLLVTFENPSWSYFAPQGVPLNFNPQVIPNLINWLQTEGNNIIYIYGEEDPWTAGAIEHTGGTNALKIIQPGANHSIDLNELDQKDLVLSTLFNWLGVDPTFKKKIISSEVQLSKTNFKNRIK